MVAAIDQKPFTHAGPAIARLLNTVATASMRHPQPVFGHPLAQRLQKLLPGQGRPKVSVSGSDELKDSLPVRRRHPIVAGSAAPLSGQSRRPRRAAAAAKARNLRQAEAENLGRPMLSEAFIRYFT